MSSPSFSSAVLTVERRSDVRGAIGAAAARTGVDFSYLFAQAKSESGLDPEARARTSSASGLYQFIDQSWLGIVKKHGAEHGLGWAADSIRRRPGGGWTVDDPATRRAVMTLREQAGPAALMAAEFAGDNAAGLSRALGRETSGTDLYMAHFLGLEGATRFLRAADSRPDTAAAALFPREARANRGIFYTKTGTPRSLGDVYAMMGRKLEKAGMDDAGGRLDAPLQLAAVRPGDLVAEPPAAGTRLTYDDDALGGEPDTGTLLASLERNRMDMLRPRPEQAKLAYLMLSTLPT